jgi:hypothetical protein
MSVSMTVNWKPSQRASQIAYLLQYRPKGASVWINATPAAVAQTSVAVKGLVADTVYEFRCLASVTGWTETSVLTELRAGVSPNAPTGLRVTA